MVTALNFPQPDLPARREKPEQQPKPVSILVVDDEVGLRRGLRALLEVQPGWRVVAEANSGRQAIAQASEIRPDIIIMDIGMPQMNGLEAARLLLESAPELRVLVLGHYVTREIIEKSIRVGVLGFLRKTDAQTDLILAASTLLQGNTHFPAETMHQLQSLTPLDTKVGSEIMTTRETEIVQLLAEGKRNRQVAQILGVSSRTVENHRARIMQKLHLDSMVDLVRYAIRNGLIEP